VAADMKMCLLGCDDLQMGTDVSEEHAVSTCMLLVSYCCCVSVRGEARGGVVG
jgi:hypothetical protein